MPSGRGAAPRCRAPATPAADLTHTERARNLTAILLHHPGLLLDVEEAFARLALPAWLERLRQAILDWTATAESLDSPGLIAHLQHSGLAAEVAQALSRLPVPLPACARPDAMPAEAEAGWWHVFGLMDPGRLEEEVAAAVAAFERGPDERSEARLVRLCTARDALRRGEQGLDASP